MAALEITSEFRKLIFKTIGSIILFVFVYFLLLIASLGLTALLVYLGIKLIILKPMFLTIAGGIGIASIGFFILIFLLKFVFAKNKSNRSHLIEITEEDEPQIFQMIREIVTEVQTKFPKKVYLSASVNAAVFYDSGFWSMFLPVKKNLEIGVGLINSVTTTELKAILAHEFGHFSQRSMKLGSFVYNVNKIIYDMLFNNDSYNEMYTNWAGFNSIFSLFGGIAIFINNGIQKILKEMYVIINKTYMGLSREMEFHADVIAASVTGYEPLKTSLLRLPLADKALNLAWNYYAEKKEEKIFSKNIYDNQTKIFSFISEKLQIPVKNNLPGMELNDLNKLNFSRLIIKDQWASHPEIEERIEKLENSGFKNKQTDDRQANVLFEDVNRIQEVFTSKIFFPDNENENEIKREEFLTKYKQQVEENSFPGLFNGYYDSKDFIIFNEEELQPSEEESLNAAELFSDEKTAMINSLMALEEDMRNIELIKEKQIVIGSFDYDGKKYSAEDAETLIPVLEEQKTNLIREIKGNDRKIFLYFSRLDKLSANPKLLHYISRYTGYEKEFNNKIKIYSTLEEGLQFINEPLPFEIIRENFENLRPVEHEFKICINLVLSNKILAPAITKEIKDNFDLYMSEDWVYAGIEEYYENHLQILFQAMNNYLLLLSRGYFFTKKDLLVYLSGLEKEVSQLKQADFNN